MKAGDRMLWSIDGRSKTVEIIRRDVSPGWWIVQPLGEALAHFAHVRELSRESQNSKP